MTDENSKNLKLIIEPDINGKELNIRQPLKCKKISNYLLSNKRFKLNLIK